LHGESTPVEVSDFGRNGDKSIVLAAVERRKRLSAQNTRVEGSAIAVALQTVAPVAPFPSELPAHSS
jgi:hypothetical protein